MPHKAERRHALWQLHAEALLRRAHLGKLHAVHVLHRPDRPRKRAAVRSDDLHFVTHGKLVPQTQHSVPFRVARFDHRTDLPLPDIARAFGELSRLPIEEARGKDILQIMGYFTAEEEKETDIFGKVLTHCEPMRWYPLFADIIARGNSKSTGIDKVLAYFDIDLKDTMAFGDGGNDIPMLKHVATGIAMGNAEPHVKAVADYVTTSVDEDGIANALKHFGLI